MNQRTVLPGTRFGAHRVIAPPGVLPQPAERLDARFEVVWDNEIIVDVETLNVDAASFRQIEEEGGGTDAGIVDVVRRTVNARGKQHNPVTNSGGMLLGTVEWVGSAVARDRAPTVGDRVATLASLTLTPLRIDEFRAVRRASAQLDVRGKAVIADGAPFARLPADLPERLSLAVLDVAGAGIQISRRAKAGQTVVILGAGGKSGILCAAEARRQVGPTGKVLGLEAHAPFAADLRGLGICDEVLSLDARDALSVYRAVLGANGGHEVDLAVCCVNVEGVELATILPVRDGGCAYFFSMSTSFTRAALGAEGVGKDVELVIGNGYAVGHADHALGLVRADPALQALFARRYG
ncbi:MAG: L-erythro-3,5-diaminohexanoate dehydrogenase [Myxococcales bacterium]|nr:L-erythro-3,5-diaminohexanoate dehydrogenase [Myxococcales bacterium]